MASSRMVLWTALSDAADDAKVASAVYARVPTPETREAMMLAEHDYAAALYPVVGSAVGFRYEATLADVIEATGSEDEAAAQLAHRGAMIDLEDAVTRETARWRAKYGS